MEVELVTKTHVKGRRVSIVLDVKLLPRGSGNRAAACRLAASFRQNPYLKPHLIRVVAGASRVTVHLRPSIDLAGDLRQLVLDDRARRDAPGQLGLWGGELA